jgi:hypothetical protein
LLTDESHPAACRAGIVDAGAGREVVRYNHIELTDPELMLDLLASPALMACSRLCGPECVTLTVDAVLKTPDSGLVKWHQGPPHLLEHPFFKVGIYLDAAPGDEDCLRFVPGTHRELQDIAAMEQEFGWDPPNVVLVPARPGDIIIQHMMILHSSKMRRRPGVRRTIYPQIRSMHGIAASGFYSDEWALVRRDWMDLIVAHADAGDRPDVRVSTTEGDLATVTARLAATVRGRECAVYAKHPTETAVYP